MAVNNTPGINGPGQGQDTLAIHQQIMKMQEEQSLRNMAMQAQQHMQQERLATISNMLKNAHESQMTIINNSRG
ncbi:MAG: hypothetical protein OEM82_06830 [Acidobacteriota bacterium]|nr:hypothetical protein [Acidobacteriota bacterium]MDH3529323.1 hypothetical protein [Acidobacteriota bacterium]